MHMFQLSTIAYYKIFIFLNFPIGINIHSYYSEIYLNTIGYTVYHRGS